MRVRSRHLRLPEREEPGWYTAQEASEILGADRQWVERRIQNGTLPASGDNPGDNSGPQIKQEDLRAFIRRHPQDLMGRNTDIVRIVEILTGPRAQQACQETAPNRGIPEESVLTMGPRKSSGTYWSRNWARPEHPLGKPQQGTRECPFSNDKENEQ